MAKNPIFAHIHFWAVAGIIVVAVAFGGGGSKYGMANFIVQLAALAALAFHRKAFFDFWSAAPVALKGLVLASLLLPVLYLMPLPPSLWQALPGRELVAQSFELLSGDAGARVWSTASVEPWRTFLALTALITPLAVLTIGWSAPHERLITIGWIAVGLGLANLLIGIPQVLSNSEVGVLYPENPMPGVLFGTFANRNSTAIFLVGALSLAALLPMPSRVGKAAIPIRLGLCLLLLLAVVLTRSRTGLVLAFLPLTLLALREILARLGSSRGAGGENRGGTGIVLGAIALGVVAIGSLVVTSPGRVGEVIERFEADNTNARAYIWDDAIYSAERYWPIGSGTGTFDDVFQVDESLENMTLKTAGRAHNDYLEVAIEAGFLGLAMIAGWLLLVAWLSWRARTSQHRWIAWSAAVFLLAIALQSISDYPLRNHSIMAFASVALLLLARFSDDEVEAGQ